MRVRLPTLPEHVNIKENPEALIQYLRMLIQALERAFDRTTDLPLTKGTIKVSNLTKQYTLDSAAGTLGDVRSVLGTLIQDLQVAGKIS